MLAGGKHEDVDMVVEDIGLRALTAALGLGLLIGLVRERADPGQPVAAGLRTHALVALMAVLAMRLGQSVFLMVLAATAGLAALSYVGSRGRDPGLTGEVTLVLTAVLGGLAEQAPALATALAVLVALLLAAKAPLQRLSRELISQRELHDGLVLLAAALVVLPMLPDRGFGPLQAFNPAQLWRLAVLVMMVGALGHVALRLVGRRWGLALAGFFAGYVSSTASVLDFGRKARQAPALRSAAVGAALLANLASVSLCALVLAAISQAVLTILWPELAAAATVLLLAGLGGVRRGRDDGGPEAGEQRMFRFGQALGFAAMLAGMTWLAAALADWLGPAGAIVASIVAASAELQAAVATLGNLALAGTVDAAGARAWLLGLLAASFAAKTGLAFVAGGRHYGLRVGAGLLAAWGAAALAAAWGQD